LALSGRGLYEHPSGNSSTVEKDLGEILPGENRSLFSVTKEIKMDQGRFPGAGIPLGRSPNVPVDLASLDPRVMNLRPVANADAFLLQFLQNNNPPKPVPLEPIQMPSKPAGIPQNSNSSPPITSLPVNRSPVVAIPAPTLLGNNSGPVHTQIAQAIPYNVTNVRMGPPPEQNYSAVAPSTSSFKDPAQSCEYKPDSLSSSDLALLTGVDMSYRTHVAQAPLPPEIAEGLSEGQLNALSAILQGKNILLTGPAGTGKSHTIKIVRDLYSKRGLKVAITATTGVSAVLVEGKTIHAWSGIGICNTKESALKRVMSQGKARERITSTVLLIIDEVSMLSGHMLDILDYIFRIVRCNSNAFGGLQVILCGDFYQLKPVKSDSYAFNAANWDSLIHEVHELSFIFRQNDVSFCQALNEIRVGEVTLRTMELLNACIGRQFEGDIQPTELYPTNDDVSWLNENELWKLASETNRIRETVALDEVIEKPRPRIPRGEKFYAECSERLNKDCLAPSLLQLAVGAQVMLTKNINVDGGLANGSRGVVVDFGPQGEPVVKFRNGHVVHMTTCQWVMRINETTKVRRTQYPLRLSFALTVHKAQGLSLDMVRVDLSRVFQHSMHYVALSRIRSIDGLSITNIDWNTVSVDPRVREFYNKHARK
jgi:ATP-dependent DNA helicase PIF1